MTLCLLCHQCFGLSLSVYVCVCPWIRTLHPLFARHSEFLLDRLLSHHPFPPRPPPFVNEPFVWRRINSFICHRQTTVVLATVDTIDFLYTCTSHLSDTGFATPINVPSGSTTPTAAGKDKPKLSDAEIKKITEEWEEKQRLKKEKEKEKEKDKEKSEGDKDSKPTTDEDAKKKPLTLPPVTPVTPTASAPVHPQFTLHRQIFAMRQAEQRKRRQVAQVRAIAPRLPSVPTS